LFPTRGSVALNPLEHSSNNRPDPQRFAPIAGGQPTVLECIRIYVKPKGWFDLEELVMKTLRITTLVIAGFLVLATTSVGAQEASSSNKQSTVKGCLSGPNAEGAYVLKSAKGHAFEVGGNDQLKSHVGHEVKLTGTWVKSGSAIGENEAAEKNEKSEAGEHHGVAERHFKVSDIQHVADSCPQGAATGAKQ
jgi:hypothetical protein